MRGGGPARRGPLELVDVGNAAVGRVPEGLRHRRAAEFRVGGPLPPRGAVERIRGAFAIARQPVQAQRLFGQAAIGLANGTAQARGGGGAAGFLSVVAGNQRDGEISALRHHFPRSARQYPAIHGRFQAHAVRVRRPSGLLHLQGRRGAQKADRPGFGRFHLSGQLAAHALRVARRHGPLEAVYRAALGDGAAEEPLGQRRGEQQADVVGARRLPGHGDVGGIAAELRDVPPHPFERRQLVHESVIAGRLVFRFAGQLGMGQEAQRAQPVVDGHQHQPAFRQRPLVEPSRDARARRIRAAVDPHEYRMLALGRPLRSGHVQVEAVLAAIGRVARVPALGELRASQAEGGGLANPAPRRHGPRLPPPQIAHGRPGVRDTLESRPAVGGKRPLDLPSRDRRHGALRRKRHTGGQPRRREDSCHATDGSTAYGGPVRRAAAGLRHGSGGVHRGSIRDLILVNIIESEYTNRPWNRPLTGPRSGAGSSTAEPVSGDLEERMS